MQKILLVAGYIKLSHLKIIRDNFSNENILFGCAYSRKPLSHIKKAYLKEFDILFDLQQPSDTDKLQHYAENILLVTCTQERDMDAYIQALLLCKKISVEQGKSYRTVINKHAFKEDLSKTHPELVPSTHLIDTTLLKKLDLLRYPQVIKPSGLAGSILVAIVDSAEAFKKHYDLFANGMHDIAKTNFEKDIDIIAEEYISGPQYSVNVYIDKDQNVTFCPISRVVTPQEMGENDSYSALQYITNEISERDFSKLQRAIQTIIEHFNIRSTSAHFDSVLHTSGWKFFEVGLRIGGNRQELYYMSHGMNHLKNDINNRLDRAIEIPKQTTAVCIVQKASLKQGILKSISYERSITTEKPPLVKEDKLAKIGSTVMPLSKGGGTITRHLVYGKNQKDVIEESKKLFHSIHFDIE